MLLNKSNPLRFLPDRILMGLATCGPVGYWGKAPGTNGTVVGILLYTVVFYSLSLMGQIIGIGFLVLFGILVCEEAEKRTLKRDPGEVIIDEIIAMPICFLGMATSMEQTGWVWLYMVAGFAIFRFFDILKPLGINSLQAYPGGLGVMLDDLAAALATNFVIRLILAVYYLN